jgi:hypothetical protein
LSAPEKRFVSESGSPTPRKVPLHVTRTQISKTPSLKFTARTSLHEPTSSITANTRTAISSRPSRNSCPACLSCRERRYAITPSSSQDSPNSSLVVCACLSCEISCVAVAAVLGQESSLFRYFFGWAFCDLPNQLDTTLHDTTPTVLYSAMPVLHSTIANKTTACGPIRSHRRSVSAARKQSVTKLARVGHCGPERVWALPTGLFRYDVFESHFTAFSERRCCARDTIRFPIYAPAAI